MVIRNPNWSIEILWYGTNYIKWKILSPIKCPTRDKLHCLFYLKLLRICSSFFFYSFSHVPDSNVSEQFIRIFLSMTLVNIAQTQTNTIFLTLTSVNNFAKNWFWRRIFLCHFFFAYPLLLFDFFDANKKTFHNIFAFNNNSLWIEHIVEKIQNTKKKIKQNARGSQIN
jgi:hypothetical protein